MAAHKHVEKEGCCHPYQNFGELYTAFMENLLERDADEDMVQFRTNSLVVKLPLLIYFFIKPILLIILAAVGFHVTTGLIVLCVIGIAAGTAGFSASHFKLGNVTLLYFVMDVILCVAEIIVLVLALTKDAVRGKGAVVIYILINIPRIISMIGSLIMFIRLYRFEKEEEEKAEKAKEEQEKKEAKAKRKARREAKQKEEQARQRAELEHQEASGVAVSQSTGPAPSPAVERVAARMQAIRTGQPLLS